MTVLKRLADVVSRLARILVPAPVEPERAPTEDDLASERFYNRQRGFNAG